MKYLWLLLFVIPVASAQSKKIDFFGTEITVNNRCIVKETSLRYDKNALVWFDAPPKLIRGTLLSTIRNKLVGKKLQEVKSEPLAVLLLKKNWQGKMACYKKPDNDSILNFVNLSGTYNNEERMLILMYKTPKYEPFRLPLLFNFLAE